MVEKHDMLVVKKQFAKINEMFGLKLDFHVIASSCVIECGEQMEVMVQFLVNNNINFFCGEAYNPHICPYNFQGLSLEGLKILGHMRKKYGIIVMAEIVDQRDIEKAMDYIDIIQIGSRNMFNYELLKEVGKINFPVLLKRGTMATVNEFLNAAEYIVMNGNTKLILCEEGIRTFEHNPGNTLDISSIAIIKKETSLPVIVDLSHSLGRADIMIPIFKAIKAIGADGAMVEVRSDFQNVMPDKRQQINFLEFKDLLMC